MKRNLVDLQSLISISTIQIKPLLASTFSRILVFKKSPSQITPRKKRLKRREKEKWLELSNHEHRINSTGRVLSTSLISTTAWQNLSATEEPLSSRAGRKEGGGGGGGG